VISHRKTARGTLLLALALLTLAAGASAATPQKIIFPVLGTVTYTDDFGAPRPGGAHQGNDLMAPKRSLALAAEAGKVEFWSHSGSAG
jgi:murein DD-endopeptidase MepM/ murein hydrolase activator NlpD